MKAVVTTSEFLSALKLFKPMASKVFTIHLTVGETSLQICGRSSTAYLDVTVPARAAGEGDDKAVVLYAELQAAASTFKHRDALTLTADGGHFSIEDAAKPGESAAVALQPSVPGSFERPLPNGGTTDEDQTVPCMTVDGAALAQALACVSPCITRGARAHMYATGYVHFAANGDQTIEVIGTDSSRLGCYALPVPSSDPLAVRSEDADMAGIEGAALTILQTMSTKTGEMFLGFGKTWGVACSSSCVLFFRLPALIYPEYRRVMERAHTEEAGEVVFRRRELVAALKKAMTIAGADTLVYLRQGARADLADMKVVDTSGECIWSTTLDATAQKLPVFRVKAFYLLHAISTDSSTTVTLTFGTGGGGDPVMVRDGSFTGLIAPLSPFGWEDEQSLQQSQDAYSAACRLPRQAPDFLLENAGMPVPASKCRKPSFKAVVDFARADTAYRRELLAALGVV